MFLYDSERQVGSCFGTCSKQCHIISVVKVELSIAQTTASLVQLNIDCTDSPHSDVKEFTIKLIPADISTSYSANISLPCPKMIQFTELTPNTTFTITILWYPQIPIPVECIAYDFTTLSGSQIRQQYTKTQKLHYLGFVASIGLPGPPTINVTGQDICFESHSYYSIDYYLIEIIDLVGDEQIFKTNGCVSLSGTQFLPQCSPYYILVTAHSQAGNSNTSNVTVHSKA